MNVQKKNLLRVLDYVRDQINRHEPERIEAESVTTNWKNPMLMKVKIPVGVGGLYYLELTYPNQED